MNQRLTKLDYLGVLYLIGKSPRGFFPFRIRLQKLVLIAKKKFGYPFSFSFRYYFYGPYSSELREVIDTLVSFGFIKELKKNLNGNSVFVYRLTKKGETRLRKKDVPVADRQKLNKVMRKYKEIPTFVLVEEAKKLLHGS